MLNLALFLLFRGIFRDFELSVIGKWEVNWEVFGKFLGSKFLFFKTVFETAFFLLQIVVHFLRFGKDIFLRVVGIASVYCGSLNVLIP